MRNANWLYILATFFALFLLSMPAYLFFPNNFKAIILLGGFPLVILGLSFRFITHSRMRLLRTQLQQIISTLERFDVDEPEKVAFQKSSFNLFNELNESILELIERIRSNYQANRQFTQNASHELQTPLAIIKGHVELLFNSPKLKEKEMESLGVIMQNTNRLSKLNHALILLSKIENNRYSDFEKINIQAIIQEILNNFKDLLNLQEIEIEETYHNDLVVDMSETLAEILFANLFQNAIRYNVADGFIRVKIEGKTVNITNSGEILKVPTATLFKRFKRESTVEESLGLGLSIVKRICDSHDIDVQYIHQHGLHQLVLKFP